MSMLLYFRALFVLIQAFCASRTLTPPTPPPPPAERDRYETVKRFQFGESGFNIIDASTTVKYMTWAVNATELLLTLAYIIPASIVAPPHRFTSTLPQFLQWISFHFLVGGLLVIFATILRVSAYRTLGRFFTYQLSIRSGHKLVTDGPYSVVRHPSYTALCSFLLGNAWCQLGPGSIWTQLGLWQSPLACAWGVVHICLAAYVGFVVSVLRVPKEDRMLRQQFKTEWNVWAKRTPYTLFPFIY